MSSSLQYPLELHRNLEARWRRLLRRTATPIKGASIDALMRSNGGDFPGSMGSIAHVIAARTPPRRPNEDDLEDDEEDEDEQPDEGRQPAVIREPDEEE